MGKTNRTKPSLAKKAPKGSFSDNLDEKMNCFLVSMILGLAIGMEASASLGIGQKVDTDEAINELKEMDASPSLEIRQNADLKDVLSKFIKEVKDNDAKHNAEIAENNAEIAELKALITKSKNDITKNKNDITKNKNDIAAVKRDQIQCISGYTKTYKIEKNWSAYYFNTKFPRKLKNAPHVVVAPVAMWSPWGKKTISWYTPINGNPTADGFQLLVMVSFEKSAYMNVQFRYMACGQI